jgi:hypothetical protein
MSGRRAAFAACLAVALLAAAGLPAPAVEPPPGSKNFVAPGFVPNYFSNESGALRGSGGVRPAPPGVAAAAYAAPPPHPRPLAAARRAGRHAKARLTKGKRAGSTVLVHHRGRQAVHAAGRRTVHANNSPSKPVARSPAGRAAGRAVPGRPRAAGVARVARAGH